MQESDIESVQKRALQAIWHSKSYAECLELEESSALSTRDGFSCATIYIRKLKMNAQTHDTVFICRTATRLQPQTHHKENCWYIY